jgi:hypothetical protein
MAQKGVMRKHVVKRRLVGLRIGSASAFMFTLPNYMKNTRMEVCYGDGLQSTHPDLATYQAAQPTIATPICALIDMTISIVEPHSIQYHSKH